MTNIFSKLLLEGYEIYLTPDYDIMTASNNYKLAIRKPKSGDHIFGLVSTEALEKMRNDELIINTLETMYQEMKQDDDNYSDVQRR